MCYRLKTSFSCVESLTFTLFAAIVAVLILLGIASNPFIALYWWDRSFTPDMTRLDTLVADIRSQGSQGCKTCRPKTRLSSSHISYLKHKYFGCPCGLRVHIRTISISCQSHMTPSPLSRSLSRPMFHLYSLSILLILPFIQSHSLLYLPDNSS